ncbi:OLC1v1003028C1 [Oldenlandia corymbosa var. corymbosa]|uniref:OLC1v1003028C1 n=1 Tax=Oldenlandia corymbosa var. corymbosa TaxID=529605 RepID=A0AAV1DAD0_OLDCO|nr:OLC1v1003028C1 [Oldenlandia corymbosa var. corymbosa]
MELQVMMPSPAVDFNFDSNCTSPYISAPSSPQRFGTFFYSAPTSPTRVSSFYREFNDFPEEPNHSLPASNDEQLSSSVPFDWEEKPGTPKSQESRLLRDEDKDFAFDFSGHLDVGSLCAADELFDGGKIKPLKPPPRLQFDGNPGADNSFSPRSPKSPKKKLKEALSPRHYRKKDIDPFEAALEQSRKQSASFIVVDDEKRSRGRTQNVQNPSSRQKGTRSLSPFRVSDLLNDHESSNSSQDNITKNGSSSSSSSFSSFWQRKWKLKDLLLFRSASEGRATGKEQFKKYALLRRSSESDEVKNSSFRSTDSVGSSVSSSKRRGQVSAHELHYTANRAVSEELKRKTYLPYKQGLLGCLGFNPGIPIHEISRSFGSIHRTN